MEQYNNIPTSIKEAYSGFKSLFGFGSSNTSKIEALDNGNQKNIPTDQDVILKIVNNFKDRSRKNIQKWRQAIALTEHAEKPRRAALQALYKDLLTDGHLQAQMRVLNYAILNTEFSISDREGGAINKEATDLVNQRWFYNVLEKAIERHLFGTTLLYFRSFEDYRADVAMIPRENVVPSLKIVIPDLTKETGYINYSDPKFENWLFQIGEDNELGLLNNIVPNLIWKRNVMQSWAEFCEKFGMPLITAETNATDEKVLDNIQSLLSQLGEASQAVLPKGTTIDIKQPANTDAFQVYSKFVEQNNNEISEAILGGTMITKDGSSRSQSEVHERNLDEKIAEAFKRDIQFLVNDVVLPILKAQGYTFIGDNDKFSFAKSQNIALDKYWNIVNGIDANYEIPEEWITKIFGVPITGKKKTVTPTNSKLSIAALDGYTLPSYPIDDCCDSPVAVSSLFGNKLQEYYNELQDAIYNKKDLLSPKAKITALEGLEFVKGLREGWGERLTDITYNAPDHLAMQLMEYNLFEFAESKTEARLASLSQLIIDKENLKINSFEDFKREAEKITTSFNNTWLETEYNLSIAVGQNSAAYHRFMSEKDTVTSYVQYQTAGDSKVRDSHQLLDGKVFSLDDPDALKIWTPNGYNCRCEFIQYTGVNPKVTTGKSAIDLLGGEWKNSQFNINRGDTKQVFTDKQFYTDKKGMPGTLAKLNFADTYGLKKYASVKKSYSKILLDSTITGKNVGELFKSSGKNASGDFMGFKDHLKRAVILPQSNFNKYTKGKYITAEENRHQLFPFINDVLEKPTEVWLAPKGKGYQLRYIKFHNNKAIVVIAELGKNNLEIITWYEMKGTEKQIRQGLLIQKELTK